LLKLPHRRRRARYTRAGCFPSLGDLTDPKLKRREFVSEFGVGLSARQTHRRGEPVECAAALRLRRDSSKRNLRYPQAVPSVIRTYQPQGQSSEEYVTKPPKNIGDNFWLKKGTFKTIPNSHTICFTCHNADSGIAPEPKSCEVCHKLAPPRPTKVDFDATLAASMGADATMLARWSRRISAGGFRHEGGEHPDLNCLNCHKVDSATFSTVDFKTMKVAVKSCGGADGCHITTTTDEGGILNFEIDSKKKDPNFTCTKCHVTFGKGPMPERSSPGDSNTETEGKELSSRLTWSRLCRLMCGRSLTFRSDRTLLRGSAPNPGAAQGKDRPNPPMGRSRHRTSGGRAASN
jgi:hypothetical protein